MALSDSNIVSLERYRSSSPASREVTRDEQGLSKQLPVPKWEGGLREQLNRLLQLKQGWDNGRARPVDPFVAGFADYLLHYVWPIDGMTPFVAPTCYGGVQLEWRLPNFELEIEIVRRHHVVVLAFDNETEEEVEFTCQHDLTKLFSVVADFAVRAESFNNAATAA